VDDLDHTAMSADDRSLQCDRLVRVVHAHLLAGAEWRLHDPQRPLTYYRLLYVIQRPFGRITSMPATGHKLPSALKSWRPESGRQQTVPEPSTHRQSYPACFNNRKRQPKAPFDRQNLI
jgi:hypothetical protein